MEAACSKKMDDVKMLSVIEMKFDQDWMCFMKVETDVCEVMCSKDSLPFAE